MDNNWPEEEEVEKSAETNQLGEDVTTSEHNNAKKQRLFSVTAFRQSLKSEEQLTSLQEFLQLCTGDMKHDYIFQYFEGGGSCMEIIQILESDSAPTTAVLEIVTRLLLEVGTKYPQLQSDASATCRYLLNFHLTMINKMLSLNSREIERKVILKLLTVIVTFSSTLAKDVLLNINFHSANLEILTKHTCGEDTVRNAFIHFVTSFLVDGYYPTLSVLLRKHYLLTVIIKGLQYDVAESVCVVLTALKNHILENLFVSKTDKMKTFSTSVIRDIVNLYNWKGPEGYDPKRKRSKTTIDEYKKSKVSECVHDFLLILCTSHAFGVIFKDHLVGLGRKSQNALMYTVLESLERPWEHSYAGELVIKICGACPDLVRTVWANLKPYLEPRPAVKWLNAVKFAKNLLNQLPPSCIEFCAKELTVYQLVQVTQILVVPTQILRTMLPEDNVYEDQAIKHQVLQFLVTVLECLTSYITAAKNWLTLENLSLFKSTLSGHIARNFPNALTVIENWKDVSGKSYEGFEPAGTLEYLQVRFDLLELYQIHSADLLEGMSNNFDLREFLEQVDNGEVGNSSKKLQVKIIRLFLSLDHTLFLPDGELFAYAVPLILEFYYNTKDPLAYDTLRGILENTSIFEGSASEIDVWINSVLNLSNFDHAVSDLLVEVIRLSAKKSVQYLTEFSKIKENLNENAEHVDVLNILENLEPDSQTFGLTTATQHTNLSPVVLGLLEYLSGNHASKSVRCFLNFALPNLLHLQTNPGLLIEILSNRSESCPKSVYEYILSWKNIEDEKLVWPKAKGRLTLFCDLSKAIFEDDIDSYVHDNKSNFVAEKEQIPSLVQMSVFYVTGLARANKLSQMHVNGCLKFIKYVSEILDVTPANILPTLLGHPVLLRFFSALHLLKEASEQGFCTYFMKEVIKHLKALNYENLEIYVRAFQSKLFRSLLKILKKSKTNSSKVEQILEVLEILELDFSQCYELLNGITKLDESILLNQEKGLSVVSKVIVYCLQRLSDLSEKNLLASPLEAGAIKTLSRYLSFLNRQLDETDTSKFASSLRRYLRVFPHCFEYVDVDLMESVLLKTTFCKENSALVVLLLSRKSDLMELFLQHLGIACTKKGLMLPVIEVAVKLNVNKNFLEQMYCSFEPSITKALQKPQKAGQHFEKHYKAVGVLLTLFLPIKTCESYTEKIQKYDSTFIFHTHLLEVIFDKVIFKANNFSEKVLNNCVLTFVHFCMNLLKKKTKTNDDWTTLTGVCDVFDNFLQKICATSAKTVSYAQVCESQAFRTFCKFCLKFGISGHAVFLKTLCSLLKFVNVGDVDAAMMLEMILSHSEFLDVVLNVDGNENKTELLAVISELCQNWSGIMQKNHVPILLASYDASLRTSDRIVLNLLRMYESVPAQTYFYDFKPFLWGHSAAYHYSVRSDISRALYRQPRMSNVLGILEKRRVLNTISHYSLDLSLASTDVKGDVDETVAKSTYDIAFLLPLFSLLLAAENAVQTFSFTRTGALSLTLLALSSADKDTRAAACHVLSRFYYHLEANHSGKDNLLWLRFVEAVCRGTGVIEDFKLNSFSAIFLARMALILTQPTHTMYVPLSQYLGTKSTLNFSSVPEVYTLLHSSDVNFKEHRSFILEILRDGMRTLDDFKVATRSMVFKLIMELFSSYITDLDTKLLILEVFRSASEIPHGFRSLCSSCGFLSWFHQVVCQLDASQHDLLPVIVTLLYNTTKLIGHFKYFKFNVTVFTLCFMIDNISDYNFTDSIQTIFLKTVLIIFQRRGQFLTESRLKNIISYVNSKECEYLLIYGGKYEGFDFNADGDKYYYLKNLTLRWINSKR